MNREQVEHEVAAVVDRWIAAEKRGDTALVAQTLADDFVAVGPYGFLLSKQAWLDRHASGAFRYEALDWDEVTVRPYQGAAVVIGRQRQEATYNGERVAMQLRTTVVLVAQHGGWQMVGVHMSAIGQPPGTR